MNVKTTLVAHLEWVEEADRATWWADSPEVAGFYAAAPTLAELQREAQAGLAWLLEDESLEIDWVADEDVPDWTAAHVTLRPDLPAMGSRGNAPQSLSGPRSCQTFILTPRPASWRVVRLTPGNNFTLTV